MIGFFVGVEKDFIMKITCLHGKKLYFENFTSSMAVKIKETATI